MSAGKNHAPYHDTGTYQLLTWPLCTPQIWNELISLLELCFACDFAHIIFSSWHFSHPAFTWLFCMNLLRISCDIAQDAIPKNPCLGFYEPDLSFCMWYLILIIGLSLLLAVTPWEQGLHLFTFMTNSKEKLRNCYLNGWTKALARSIMHRSPGKLFIKSMPEIDLLNWSCFKWAILSAIRITGVSLALISFLSLIDT